MAGLGPGGGTAAGPGTAGGRASAPPVFPAVTGPLGAIRWAGAESCAARDSPWRPAGPEDCPLPLPPGSLCRREGRRVRLAAPYDREGPFPLTELFCLARIRAMDGGLWAEYRFEDGYPVPPEEN